MKKLISFVAVMAMSVMALVSCQKEIDATKTVGRHSVHFTVDLETATKTVLSGTTVNWTEADASLFHVFENGVEAAKGDMEVEFKDGIATVTAVFDNTDAVEFKYTAFVASVNSSKKPCVLKVQTPTANSYDSAADVLIAEPIVTTDRNDALELKFKFARPVSINKMTLKGIQEGEKISKVVLTGTKSLAGSYGSFDPEQNFGYSGTDKMLTINATSDVVYFVTSEAVVTPTIEVTTDKAVYSKTFAKEITFAANELHSFSVTFSADDRKTADASYGLVNNLSDLEEGDVIVLGCAAKSAAAGPMGEGIFFTSAEATVTNNVLKSANVIEITLGKDGDYWTLKTDEGYVGATAAKALSVDPDANGYVGTWTISFNKNSAVVSSTKSGYGSIQYNSGSPRFLNYATAQGAIEIYKKGFTPSDDTINPDPEYKGFPYEESFDTSMGDFTINNVVLPSELSYVWKYDGSYQQMKASAYVNSKNYATESWLVSPMIDMSNAKKPVLSFEHTYRYGSDATKELTLWASEDGENWSKLAIGNYGDSSNWEFVTNKVDISTYAGKTLQFAFKYISSSSAAEIKRLSLFFIFLLLMIFS